MKKIIAILAAMALGFIAMPSTAQEYTGSTYTRSADIIDLKEQIAKQFAELLPQMSSNDIAVQGRSQLEWKRIVFDNTRNITSAEPVTVNRLMTEALEGDSPVVTKAWLLHLLQWSGTRLDVPVIARFLDSDEVRLRDAAARALAQIPTTEAATALEAAVKAGKDAARFEEALKDRVRQVGNPGNETAMPQAIPYQRPNQSTEYLAGWEQMDDLTKSRTLANLKVRAVNGKIMRERMAAMTRTTARPAAALPLASERSRQMYQAARAVTVDSRELALEAVKSENDDLKRSAILLLGEVGEQKDLPVLTELLFTYDRGFMTAVLKNMAVDGIDESLFAAMLTEHDAGRLETLADICVGRFNVGAAGAILAAAKQSDCPNRLKMLQIAEGVSTKENVGDAIDAMRLIPIGGERDRAEQIIARLCRGDAAPVLAKMTDANRDELLPCLGRIGGPAVLTVVMTDFNAPALRALCNWPDATVADKLWEISQDATNQAESRTAALRAFIRVSSLPDDEIGIETTSAAKLENLKKAFAEADPAEKRLSLERAAAVRDVATLQWAESFLGDSEFAASAYKTIVELGHHDFLRKADPAAFKAALQKVIDGCKDEGLVNRAKDYLGKIR